MLIFVQSRGKLQVTLVPYLFYFKLIKKEEGKLPSNIEISNKIFTLNDCNKISSDSSKKGNNESPMHTFQVRGSPINTKNSKEASSISQIVFSNKKNEFIEVSNNNFEEISEIQMIDNMEPDSFKLNEKSTLKGTNYQDFNYINYESNENLVKNINEITFLLEIEREKNNYR